MTFAVNDDIYAPAALFVDTSQNMAVSYSGTIWPFNAPKVSSSSVPSPTSAKSSESSKTVSYGPCLAVLIIVSLSALACF
jgi:hypothetical protein